MRIKDGWVGKQGARGKMGFAIHLVATSIGSPGQPADPGLQTLMEG